MKLPDIKKLKVMELRARLKALGLDSKGLKAELVERLWAASEAGRGGEEPGEDPAEDPRPPEVNLQPPASLTAEVLSTLSEVSPPVLCEVKPGKELSDSATQTEPDSGAPASRQPANEAPLAAEGRAGEPVSQRRSAEDRGRAFYEFKEEIRYKRAKSPLLAPEREETGEQDEDKVRLDPYSSHLHFEMACDGWSGHPRFWSLFPLLWSGCRLTHGVSRGRVSFEVRLERKLLTPQPEDKHIREDYGLRVGWSVANSSLLLGEDELSFSYDAHGKKVSAGNEVEFGEPFSEGDIIGCFASFSTDGAVELSFSKNGRFMGVGFTLDALFLQGRALFPHVLCKSCSVRLNLDPTALPWYPGPSGFTPLAALPFEQRLRSLPAPGSKAQSEMVLMVGLPGSGKSVWAKRHMKKHPEKQFRLLGTEELLACMISGGQRDSRLLQASQCLTHLIKVAAETPGNYILDQCNILFSARRHKLQLFAGFRRQVVVVFPSAHQWKKRLSQHQINNGEHIPEIALLKLQVSCSLPEHPADLLEELQYVDLPQDEAQKILQKFKDEARRLLPPVSKQQKKPRYFKKKSYPGPPPPQRIQWMGWNTSKGPMQPWNQQQRYWSSSQPDQSGYYNTGLSHTGYGNNW